MLEADAFERIRFCTAIAECRVNPWRSMASLSASVKINASSLGSGIGRFERPIGLMLAAQHKTVIHTRATNVQATMPNIIQIWMPFVVFSGFPNTTRSTDSPSCNSTMVTILKIVCTLKTCKSKCQVIIFALSACLMYW